MTQDCRRITLVTRSAGAGDRDWTADREAANRIVFLEALTVLRYAIESGVAEMQQDVERVIVDRCASASQYLELVAALPAEFTGDVVCLHADDSGYLSATAPGSDRVLYSLSRDDVRFYLEDNDLVARPVALAA